MIPTNTSELYKSYTVVGKDSGGFVFLIKPGHKNGKWQLWVDNKLIFVMRESRALSFLDGWKLATSVGQVNNKALLIKSENEISPQK